VVSVTSILGGNSDNTGSGIARRLGNFVMLLTVLCFEKLFILVMV
jgi:hypothetical protein